MIATPVGKIEPSVCFGTTRWKHRVEYNEDKYIVTYQLRDQIINFNSGFYTNVAKYTYVVMPVITSAPTMRPVRVELDFVDPIIERFFTLFRNDQKMVIARRLGKALVDLDKGG
ncbi:hypothetical protein FNAPI_13855 [Fusarium napiforme]|uniref:Uncharacterized protein n=1 Tax=Fusarium napiforme TaxID=42672 RepID=A0A8H5MH77_9HYPO|nr:hypothetical protein FNAPI_13855 [Fusarium napiforme]